MPSASIIGATLNKFHWITLASGVITLNGGLRKSEKRNFFEKLFFCQESDVHKKKSISGIGVPEVCHLFCMCGYF